MGMIKLIKEDTDISALEMKAHDWDVCIKDIPYQVVSIIGYIHSINLKYGPNDLWMYPRSETPTYKNLIQYYSDNPFGVSWGIQYYRENQLNYGHGEIHCITDLSAIITRNGKKFYSCSNGLVEAEWALQKLQDHPLELYRYEWDKKILGREVWYRDQPAKIIGIRGNDVVLIPDGIDAFRLPAYLEKEKYYDRERVIEYALVDLLTDNIFWFR